MATLTSQQLKDSYQSLVTIGDSITSDPTSGQLENGKGTPLTAVGIGTNNPNAEFAVVINDTTSTPSILIGNNDLSARSALLKNHNDASNFDIIASASATADKGLRFFTDTATERMKIHSSGDISFRDGATNEAFYWDASTARLGLGTTTPNSKLNVISNGVGTGIWVGSTNSNFGLEQWYNSANGAVYFDQKYNNNNGSIFFRTKTLGTPVNALTILGSGNVGIGTTSPSNLLHIQGTSDGGTIRTALFENVASLVDSKAEIMLVSGGNTNRGSSIANINESASGQPASMVFSTSSAFANPTERMRIDSSGNVTLQTVGAQLRFQNSLGPAPYIENSGEDASTAPYGQDLLFATGGGESMRILSSGGITFNGDTATANALDDYEEGTFTPTIAFGGGSTAVTYTNASGYYTKIGNIVHFTALIDLSSKGTDTGDVTIGGLPFTATSASGRFPDVNTRVIQNVVVDTFLQSAVLNNTTTVGILQYNSTTDDQEYLTDADFSNNSELNVTGFYFT